MCATDKIYTYTCFDCGIHIKKKKKELIPFNWLLAQLLLLIVNTIRTSHSAIGINKRQLLSKRINKQQGHIQLEQKATDQTYICTHTQAHTNLCVLTVLYVSIIVNVWLW